MKIASVVKTEPIEMLVSKTKVKVPQCIEAMSEISRENFDFEVQIVDNFLLFQKKNKKICTLAFLEKGVVILERVISPEFILILRLSVATMIELTTEEPNDFEELQDLLGQKIDFSNSLDDTEDDTEEVVSCDPDEASLDAIRLLYKDCTEDSVVPSLESSNNFQGEEESESEWI